MLTRFSRGALVAAALMMITAPTMARADTTPATGPPAGSIVLLETIAHTKDGVHYRGVGYGTAFIVDPQGIAITDSHVVYLAQHDPAHYWLLAIANGEFYGATITCASRLPYDPTHQDINGVPLSRDIAEIALTAPPFPFKKWGYSVQGTFALLATAHQGPLPQFPSLAFGNAPADGQAITITGYSKIGPLPELWTSTGQVEHGYDLRSDGTPVFSMTFTSPPQPGGSGSPVLDAQGRVVGIFTWYGKINGSSVTAQTLTSAQVCG